MNHRAKKDVAVQRIMIAAALVWYIGVIVLLFKGGSLLIEAKGLQPHAEWPWLAALFGMCLGIVKARFLFIKACNKNLMRIQALKHPRLWQCFRPVFFVFLAMMILTGAALSRSAQGNYIFWLGVAVLDLSIATALLGSSRPFWQCSHRQ